MQANSFDFEELRRLVAAEVDFVVIGGMAMVLHGSSHVTQDLAVFYRRTREQAEAIVSALQDLQPRLRDLPDGRPSVWDVQTLLNASICRLSTDAGAIDFIAEAPGAPHFEVLKSWSQEVVIDRVNIRFASANHLLEMKEATGRAKDQAHVAELRQIIADDLAREVRATGFWLLDLIGSYEDQLAYQEVSIADVFAELACMWFDDWWFPDGTAFRDAFSDVELLALREFSDMYDKALDRLRDEGIVDVLQLKDNPIWDQVMAEAQRALAVLQVKGWEYSPSE